MSRVVAEARTNIALVKYWGKRGERPAQLHQVNQRNPLNQLNLPAVGSLSLTLDGLATRTEVRFDSSLAADCFELGDRAVTGEPLGRVARFLDLVRARAGMSLYAAVRSQNNFPTAAGLASSASGFAALALAATRAAGLSLDGRELSRLARQGSGSAARSIFGGFVLLHRGELVDGSDCFAEPIGRESGPQLDANPDDQRDQGHRDRQDDPSGWDVRMVIGVVGEGPKATLSTNGMDSTAATSPYFRAWVDGHPAELAAARDAVLRRDLAALGEIAERSCLRMHASALAAAPGILYWTGATVDGFHAVRALRAAGVPAWFTNDAGPHVKAICAPEAAAEVAAALAAVPGIGRTVVCAPGAAACVLEEEP